MSRLLQNTHRDKREINYGKSSRNRVDHTPPHDHNVRLRAHDKLSACCNDKGSPTAEIRTFPHGAAFPPFATTSPIQRDKTQTCLARFVHA